MRRYSQRIRYGTCRNCSCYCEYCDGRPCPKCSGRLKLIKLSVREFEPDDWLKPYYNDAIPWPLPIGTIVKYISDMGGFGFNPKGKLFKIVQGQYGECIVRYKSKNKTHYCFGIEEIQIAL